MTETTTEEQPEVQPQFGDDDALNRGLPDDLQLQLRALCRKFGTREVKDRRWEIRRARKARYFWRGSQHLLWNDDQQTMIVGQLGGTVVTNSGEGGASNMPQFVRDYNIYTPYGKVFAATFSQNEPATRFEPDDPKESMDLRSAAAANAYRRIFEKWNPPRHLQIEMARLFWTDGRVVTWTRYEQDAKYGKDQDGKPRGREITTVHGVLEHKCPITMKNQDLMAYQQISEDLDTAIVKDLYPWIADKIQEGNQGTMDDAFARNARIATAEGTTVLSEGGDALAHLSTIDHFWLRPAAFRTLEDEYRAEFVQRFPDGLRVSFVGDVYAAAEHVSMDDELRIFQATEGDGQNRNGIGDWLIPVQETFNNLMNMTQEYYEYGIPEEWFDSEMFDIDSNQDRRATPGNRQTFRRPKGEPAQNLYFTTERAEPAESMLLFQQWMQGDFAQFITGQSATLFGESDKHNETAKGIALMRNQAMGLVGLVWRPFCLGWSDVVHQAVKCARKHRTGMVSALVPSGARKGSNETVSVDIEDLRGNVLSSPETDENFPESWTEKSNRIMMLFQESEKNPAFAQIAMLPANLQLFKAAQGLDDFEIPGAAANDKQLEEIEELLLTGPMTPPPQIDPASGEQMPQNPQPTIPVDPDFDDHGAEWQAGLRWVNDPEQGQKTKRENPQGFLNVRLHLLQHKQIVDQQQAQQMQAQMAMKHGQPASPDPAMQQEKMELVRAAADGVQQLDVLSHVPIQYTGGNIQGQVQAAAKLIDAAVKASTN